MNLCSESLNIGSGHICEDEDKQTEVQTLSSSQVSVGQKRITTFTAANKWV